MMPSRKLSMQLTPLLDLLLIVIFAQFMDFRERQAEAVGSTSVSINQNDQSTVTARQTVQQLQERLQVAEQYADTSAMRIAKAEADSERYQRLLQHSKEDLDRTLAQHRVLGELVVELFNVPSEEVARILDTSFRPTGLSESELTQLKDKFREMSMQQSGKMIEHLLSYEEIRKRCDVWTLHVSSKDVITLDTGSNVFKVRIPFNIKKDVDNEKLLIELYSLYRSLPQPKSLVIVLLTYDRETSIGITDPMREILPRLVTQMQSDRAGAIRFEYADLGFSIE